MLRNTAIKAEPARQDSSEKSDALRFVASALEETARVAAELSVALAPALRANATPEELARARQALQLEDVIRQRLAELSSLAESCAADEPLRVAGERLKLDALRASLSADTSTDTGAPDLELF